MPIDPEMWLEQKRQPNEVQFRQWYANYADQLGLNPNPDDPLHFYDYRAAYRAGVKPDKSGHWPSEFKKEGHPNMFVNGMNTQTGQPVDPEMWLEQRKQPESLGAKVNFDPIDIMTFGAANPEIMGTPDINRLREDPVIKRTVPEILAGKKIAPYSPRALGDAYNYMMGATIPQQDNVVGETARHAANIATAPAKLTMAFPQFIAELIKTDIESGKALYKGERSTAALDMGKEFIDPLLSAVKYPLTGDPEDYAKATQDPAMTIMPLLMLLGAGAKVKGGRGTPPITQTPKPKAEAFTGKAGELGPVLDEVLTGIKEKPKSTIVPEKPVEAVSGVSRETPARMGIEPEVAKPAPIKLYRGTNKEGTPLSHGEFYSPNKKIAQWYGDIVQEVELNAKSGDLIDFRDPKQFKKILYGIYKDKYNRAEAIKLNESGTMWEMKDLQNNLLESAEAEGYKGAILKDVTGTGSHDSYVIFDESIVKKPAPSAKAVEGVKEPWELTKQEWDNATYVNPSIKGIWNVGSESIPELKNGPRQVAAKSALEAKAKIHKMDVRRALSEGKPVPAEVLADYPELKPKPAETPKVDRWIIDETMQKRGYTQWNLQDTPWSIRETKGTGKPFRVTFGKGDDLRAIDDFRTLSQAQKSILAKEGAGRLSETPKEAVEVKPWLENIPDEIRPILNRVTYEKGRFLEETVMNLSKKDSDAIAKYLVDTKHPQTFEAGTRNKLISNYAKEIVESKTQKTLKSQRGAVINPSEAGFVGPRETVEIPEKPADIGLSSSIQSPAHLFGAYPEVKAKYGKTAQQAQKTLLLAERDMKVELGRRGADVEAIVKSIPKKDFGKIGDKFIDIFNGKDIKDIETRTDISSETKTAAKQLRQYFESDKKEIISRKREMLRPSIEKLAEAEYRAENELYRTRIRGAKDKAFEAQHLKGIQEKIDAKLKDAIPENWGIDNYFPQIHMGDYRVVYKGEYIGSASTKAEVHARIMDHHAGILGETGEKTAVGDYQVTRREFHDPDVVRVSRKRYYKIINDLNKASEIDRTDIQAAMRGKFGSREGRQKWAFFQQKRYGAEGYSKDFNKVMDIYNRTFVRWKHLTDLNKEIQPLLQKIRNEGRTGAAEYLENNFRELWGYRKPSSRKFDITLSKIPYLKDHVRPFMLERFAGSLKGAFTTMVLKLNPRFHLLNRMQTFQTLLPLVKNSEFIAGRKLYHSVEGRELLNKHGVKYLTGGKIAEGQRVKTKPSTREKMHGFAPETFNQETAWLTMYDKARKSGLSDKASADYAFLAGNIRSQYLYMRSDMPSAFRGPIRSTLFMYKRFPVKTIEMGLDLVKEHRYSGFSKFVASQALLGGARLVTKPLMVAGGSYLTYQMYKEIKEDYGETVANAIAFGLPGLVGMDWSYSVQLIDMPYGENTAEKIGNFLLGPPGQFVVRTASAALDTKGPEDTSAPERVLKRTIQTLPSLRWIESLEMVLNDDYNFKDPAGRIKFKGDLKDVLMNAFGARSAKAGADDMFIEALMEIKEKRDPVIDKAVQQIMADKFDEADSAIIEWNELWPEYPILSRDLEIRARTRIQDKDLTRVERFLKRSGYIFRASDTFGGDQ